MIILLVQAPWSFIGNCKKTFYPCPSIRKCHKCLEINIVYFALVQFHSKKAMSQPPCFDIEYWRSYYSPFLSRNENTNYLHRITLLIECHIVLQKNKPVVAGTSTVGFSCHFDHSYGIIYLSSAAWVLCCWMNITLCRNAVFKLFCQTWFHLCAPVITNSLFRFSFLWRFQPSFGVRCKIGLFWRVKAQDNWCRKINNDTRLLPCTCKHMYYK